MQHKISIIIPTYNRCHLIGATIDSILHQTFPAYEIIVVDDHSTDFTIEWLTKKYLNKIIIATNTGKGPGAARNTGLTLATGNYIKFFDSDDVMSPNSLEEQLKTLVETGKPFVTSPYIYAKERNGQWTPVDNYIINYYGFPINKPLTHWMCWGLFICIPTMLFSRDFINRVGLWPEDVVTSEDWLYLWRMAMLEPFPAHTSNCWFYYRVHDAQSTGNNITNTERDKEKAKVLFDIYQCDLLKSTFTYFEQKLFTNKFYQMARMTTDLEFKKWLMQQSGNLSPLIWQYYRIVMKIGRMQTGSNWQPMHGVKLNLELSK